MTDKVEIAFRLREQIQTIEKMAYALKLMLPGSASTIEADAHCACESMKDARIGRQEGEMLDRESIRCLRFLTKQPANLEWPCRNVTIPWLIDRGFARKTREYQSRWNYQMHVCAEIAITEEGRKALQQTPGA